ncbi:hypothetical protein UFOVP355_2 [uncultured Caudovirales phage]|uniref:Uncharacterized protein n=1 Tax=uncultured Caudovirales phage TaxID=2100421 RepID=A0A6J5M461_9CAUD|nr:hypothetical protein UFOVP355_2 [uncultured Caudovirales phage]CAB4156854.1 hypothetical protein UFOVP677_2 [uncultured Caudovirales phage]
MLSSVWVPIIVAVIMGPVVVVLQKLRKENTEQHSEGRILLKMIGTKVDKIGSKLDNHIGWHDGQKDAE